MSIGYPILTIVTYYDAAVHSPLFLAQFDVKHINKHWSTEIRWNSQLSTHYT